MESGPEKIKTQKKTNLKNQKNLQKMPRTLCCQPSRFRLLSPQRRRGRPPLGTAGGAAWRTLGGRGSHRSSCSSPRPRRRSPAGSPSQRGREGALYSEPADTNGSISDLKTSHSLPHSPRGQPLWDPGEIDYKTGPQKIRVALAAAGHFGGFLPTRDDGFKTSRSLEGEKKQSVNPHPVIVQSRMKYPGW